VKKKNLIKNIPLPFDLLLLKCNLLAADVAFSQFTQKGVKSSLVENWMQAKK
jgi:hypothetical protein